MYIAIINWPAGENDPFTFFSEHLKRMIEGLGREVIFLQLNNDFMEQLNSLRRLNIDFAITFQGLASNIRDPQTGENIWDQMKIPLFTLHGDHPSLRIDNHEATADFVVHHYAVSSFNHYANRYIPRKRAAMVYQTPLFFPDLSDHATEGDWFVIPKNHDDTQGLMEQYGQVQTPEVRAFLLETADLIASSMRRNPQTDHHRIIDDMIFDSAHLGDLLQRLGDQAMSIIHQLHGLLEKFYRNQLAEIALEELRDFPVRIYGRGWDRFKGRNPRHEFLAFDKVADGNFQFLSNYGVVDVCPAFDSLHDRTQRALSGNTSILIGSAWPQAVNFPDAKRHLFYAGVRDDLKTKADAVVCNPERHRERCNALSQQYRLWASDMLFLRHFETMATIVRNGTAQ